VLAPPGTQPVQLPPPPPPGMQPVKLPPRYVTAANQEQLYDYYAFISYSRKDEKWAQWLQKKLEHYQLPSVIRKEDSTLPKKIQPIFRDKTDLTTGQLQAALIRELNASKKLIVLCSPTSARSRWVNEEVLQFISQGRIADIIPVIIEGSTSKTDETACYPPALRISGGQQLLGISIPDLGKSDTFLRVVAGILDIKFDQLKRRNAQRKKRQRFIAAAATFVVLAIAGIGGYQAWDYYVPHESYYADYVLRWGVPEGIGELTKKELASREGHYIIVTQQRQVKQLIHANSAGIPSIHQDNEHIDRPMISHFYYRDDGNIEYVEFLDHNHRVLATQVYTTDLLAADFQVSAADSSVRTLAGATTSNAVGLFDFGTADFDDGAVQRSDIARYAFEYNNDGYVTQIIYMRDRRTPILDADGIGGLEYTLDTLGRPIEVRYLGLDGQLPSLGFL